MSAPGQLPLTTYEGVLFEQHVEGQAVGFKVTDLETGRVEYVLLNPSTSHEINEDNGAIADVFVYHVIGELDPDDPTGDNPVTYINLFEERTGS